MHKKDLTIFLFFTIFSLLLVQNGFAINLCRWQGFANKSGTLINTTDYITIHNGTKVYNATLFITGMYTADVQTDNTSASIGFKICGVSVQQGAQAWSCPASDFNVLNISITSLADGAACSYSCACSGGYCCSGATQYTAGEGTGTCRASACVATTTATTSPGGGGGGGSTVATTTAATTAATSVATTTVVLPPIEETDSLISILSGNTGNFTYTKDLAVTEIELTVANTVTNARITVSKQGTIPSNISIAAPGIIFAYLTFIPGNFVTGDISQVKIKFKVDKSWITANNVDAGTITLNKFVDGAWQALQTVKTSEDDGFVYFEAVSSSLSVYAITGRAAAATTATTTTVPSEFDFRILALPVGIVVIAVIIVLLVREWMKFSKLKKAAPQSQA